MKIELKYVKFKNFLSFGSKMQEVEFKRGVNLVLGHDDEKGKSNGSGKTSFLETVPFALFGKVHRNIKKEQIVNWKNRKGCEVHLAFQKGESEYRIFRGIKPDKFEIYKDNELVDKPAHTKDYQLILDNIVGMNFNTFMSLVHSNINSSAPILAMKKPEKRKFIEKVFGLELYTKLHEICNEKLKNSNERIKEMDFSMVKNREVVKDAEQRIRSLNLKLKEMGSSENELNEAEEVLKALKDADENWTDKLEALDKELEIIERTDDHHDFLIRRLKEKETLTLQKIRMMVKSMSDIEKDLEKTDDILTQKRKMETIVKFWGSPPTIEEKIEYTVKLIEEYDGKIENGREGNQQLTSLITRTKDNIKRVKKQIDTLSKDKKCPTCGTDVEGSNILQDLEDEISEDQEYIDRHINRLDELEELMKEIIKSRGASNEALEELKDRKMQYLLLEKEVNSSNRDELTERLKSLKESEVRSKSVNKKLESKRNEIEKYRDSSIRKIEIMKEEKNELSTKIHEISQAESVMDKLGEKVAIEKGNKETYTTLIDKDELNIKKFLKENRDFKNKMGKLNDLKDYMDFIKECCGDEKVKQYAISSIMPYLNKQTNRYLSDVGYNFWVKLDKWLDAHLEGPGITKGSYGSLSGGEGRGIDLALQFAFLDIARLRAGSFPDVNIMDEILDSSIDVQGLQKIVDIIQSKQREDDSKVFIISHRQEVDELDIDNVYFITKKDGYSSIKILEKQ